ncbi:hypothetical protein AB0O14_19125 [Microbacterium foliorum]|uniref:hypothetical protein n=1 Tax=Rothia terrae TaxID=396015 RepID=UPI00342455CE
MSISYENHIHNMVDLHLSNDSGSKYWSDRTKDGWTKDVVERWFLEGVPPKNYLQLEEDLRILPVESFIPRKIERKEIVGVYESGGTTGVPKRVVLGNSWMNEILAWSANKMINLGHQPGRNWLVAVPSGPHVVGELAINAAYNENALAFRIDIDPRWAKSATRFGGSSDGYSTHLASQVAEILRTQNIGCIVTTPPILLKLARNHDLVSIINNNRITIRWGGLPFDKESQEYMKKNVFPNTPFFGVLGNTMTLGFGIQCVDSNDKIPAFEFYSPYNKAMIYDSNSDQFVLDGNGRIAYSHASATHLYPPIPDRDSGQVSKGKFIRLEEGHLTKGDTSNGVY